MYQWLAACMYCNLVRSELPLFRGSYLIENQLDTEKGI